MKKEVEEKDDFVIDDKETDVTEQTVEQNERAKKVITKPIDNTGRLQNCLKNERVIVRFVPHQTGLVTDKKHVLYGGMADSATCVYTVPMLQSGQLVNVLTDSEKAFLEDYMGLEYNALSVYRKDDNYWFNRQVILRKEDNYLNLRVPDDYIKYKILLANKDNIAPNINTLHNQPKATYKFVLIKESEQNRSMVENMTTTMQSYKEFGKIEDDRYKLRLIIEEYQKRPVIANASLELMQTKCSDLIQENPKRFLEIITDPLIDNKVLIKKAQEINLIYQRSNQYYLAATNEPMSDNHNDAILSVAAQFLNNPVNQEIKFKLEAKIK